MSVSRTSLKVQNLLQLYEPFIFIEFVYDGLSRFKLKLLGEMVLSTKFCTDISAIRLHGQNSAQWIPEGFSRKKEIILRINRLKRKEGGRKVSGCYLVIICVSTKFPLDMTGTTSLDRNDALDRKRPEFPGQRWNLLRKQLQLSSLAKPK